VRLLFWTPPKLQDGTTKISTGGINFNLGNLPLEFYYTPNNLFGNLDHSPVASILTQYCMRSPTGSAEYISGHISDGGWVKVTDDYPSRGLGLNLTVDAVNMNDVHDRILQTIEANSSKGWTIGPGQEYIVVLDPGEQYCVDTSYKNCSSTPPNNVCGVHASYNEPFGPYAGQNLVYAVIPPDPACGSGAADLQDPLTLQVVGNVFHEFVEMATDPLATDPLTGQGKPAWATADSKQNEIADVCSSTPVKDYAFDDHHADVVLSGNYYSLPTIWSANANGCVLDVGRYGDAVGMPGLFGTSIAGTVWGQTPSGGYGESISLGATNFTRGEAVNVEYATGLGPPNQLVPLCRGAIANADGTISCSADVPDRSTAGALGVHRITFTGGQSGVVATVNFTLAAVQASPYGLDFGAVPVGSTSTALVITLKNWSATTSYQLEATQLRATSPSTDAEWPIAAGACDNTTLRPGATCTIAVSFSPDTQGPGSAVVEVSTLGNQVVQLITLTGVGAAGTQQTGFAMARAAADAMAQQSGTVCMTQQGQAGFPHEIATGDSAAAFNYFTGACGATTGSPFIAYVYNDAAGWHPHNWAVTQNFGLPGIPAPFPIRLTSSCLNVHISPSTSSPTAGCLASGTLIETTGIPQFADGQIWWRVELASNGTPSPAGWAAHDYLLCGLGAGYYPGQKSVSC
jgi:hypothetical protein